MTRIALSEDPGKIFAGFIYTLTVVAKYRWMPRGPLAGVPDVLLEKVVGYPELAQLSGQKHPMDELVTSGPELKRLVEDAEVVFQHLWNERAVETADRVSFMEQMLEEFGAGLDQLIENVTRVPWPYDEVWLVPAMYAGGTVTHNIVLAGFPPKPGHIDGYAHELVHVNTRLSRRDLKGELCFPKDSNEITVVLLTNQVIGRLKTEKGLELAYNKFSGYEHKIESFLPDLQSMAGQEQGYEWLVRNIDAYLAKHDYHRSFQQNEFSIKPI